MKKENNNVEKVKKPRKSTPRKPKIILFNKLSEIVNELTKQIETRGGIILDKSKDSHFFLIALPRKMDVMYRNYNNTFQPLEKLITKDVCLLNVIKIGNFDDKGKWPFQKLIEVKCPKHTINCLEGTAELIQSFYD